MTKKSHLIAGLLALLCLAACDPGHSGMTRIHNESSYSLTLKYKSYRADTTLIIQPNSLVDVYYFGGLGSGKDYNCCRCEFDTISLQPIDPSRRMMKPIMEPGNWTMTNPNEKRFSNKDISCEFLVTQADIQ